MIASVISIGDELLIGQTVNTNASFIAAELNKSGFPLKSILTIGDNRDDILYALRETATYSTLVIITGGLGPTGDDITKNTLCDYFGSKLLMHKPSLNNILEIFEKRNFVVSEINRRQALVPHNCEALKNRQGTAPGMWFQKNKVHYISLPGVPFEMKTILTEEVIPKLLRLNASVPIIHKTILTTGIGESALAELISNWETNLPPTFKLAYLPEPGIVKLRLSCYNSEKEKTKNLFNTEIRKLKKLIPDLIFGYDNDTMESLIGNFLFKQKASISVAESCTGGLIAHLITSVPGSSRYFKGSVVAYDNVIKSNVLGVDNSLIIKNGAVSEQVVKAMATGVKKLTQTDYALATSGVAGPDGGTPEKPVGTVWIALATHKKIFTEKLIFTGDRERIIRRASMAALNLLRIKANK